MTQKTAIVTGAGSGVGRAVVLQMAREGWAVAAVGRRADTVEETRTLARPNSVGHVVPIACDVADAQAVERMVVDAVWHLGGNVHALVNSAGTNAPRRSLELLSLDDYHAMIDVNLNGTFYCVRTVLPHMRTQGSGSIVNIVSDSVLHTSPKAGPGYVASKAGVKGLTQAINAEERGRGIRACAIFPGDIDTPLLNKRPNPPTTEARTKMMTPEDVAQCVMLVLNLPQRTVVEEMLMRPL